MKCLFVLVVIFLFACTQSDAIPYAKDYLIVLPNGDKITRYQYPYGTTYCANIFYELKLKDYYLLYKIASYTMYDNIGDIFVTEVSDSLITINYINSNIVIDKNNELLNKYSVNFILINSTEFFRIKKRLREDNFLETKVSQ